jgi:hypothetical protein
MSHLRRLGLLCAACLPLILAACAGEMPSAVATAEGISTVTAANGTQFVVTSGGGQAGAPGQRLAAPVVVRVTDRAGRGLANRQVIFNRAFGSDVDPRVARTDADGYARTTWTLGPEIGVQSLRVSGPGALVVTANVQRGTGTRLGLVKLVGDEDEAPAGSPLGAALQAAVVRDDGTLVSGALVTFTANDGGRVDRATARTNGRGVAQARWTLGPAGGPQTLTASTPGAEPVVFMATATGGTKVQRNGPVLRLSPDSLVLDAGASAVLTASLDNPGEPQLPGQAPKWSSSDPAVATVDGTGTVRGVAEGTATITAALGSHVGTATVRVRGGPASLRVQPDSLVLDVDATGQLTAVIRNAAGAELPGQAPAWSSENPAVATVNAQGQVRGVAPGTVRVTATLGSLTASASVRVRGRGPSLQLFPDSLVLDIGVWGKLFPVARDASGKVILGYNLEWSSTSDQVVFPMSDGSLLPIGAGTARVTARLGDLSASVQVRVRPPRGGSITIPQIQKRVSSAGGIIDPSTRDLELNFWIHTSVRGVSSLSMRVRGPSGQTINCANVGAENYFQNEFRCQIYLPRGAEPGVWRVDQVTVTKDGRATVFTGADLDAMGTLGRLFDVFGAGADTQPPLVRMLWPHQGTRYPDIYYLQIGIIDHVSGVRGARMTVRGPGGVTHSCEVSKSAGELAKGGGGVCRLPLRPGSGTWDLVSVEVEDGAGNRATYTPQQIAQLASGMSEAPFFVYSFTP